jgi:hypothetical protein
MTKPWLRSSTALMACVTLTMTAATASAFATSVDTAVRVPLPVGALSSTSQEAGPVACSAPGTCVSAIDVRPKAKTGDYPYVVNENAGVWSHPVALSLPLNAHAGSALVFAMTCFSAHNCTAVGGYYDGNSKQGFAASEVNGVWARAVELAPVGTSGVGEPLAVSCTSATDCVAVGEIIFGIGAGAGLAGFLVATETAGTWSSSAIPAPSDLTSGFDFLSGVSCVSAGNCVAIGSYETKNGYEGFDIEQTLGVWGSAHAISGIPSSPSGAGFPSVLDSLSCSDLADCVAVGSFTRKGTSVEQGVMTQEVGGTWSALRLIQRPAGAFAAGGSDLDSVSCTSPGNCLAVGSYAATRSVERPLGDVEKNGVWARSVVLSVPTDATKSGSSSALSVSCASATSCVVGGTYQRSSTEAAYEATWGSSI